MQERFERRATDRCLLIEDQFSESEYRVNAIRRFFLGSERVDRLEFHNFVTADLEPVSGIHSLSWAPRVLHAERASHEAMAVQEGLPGYHIWENGPGGVPTPCAVQEEYYPLFYRAPAKTETPFYGFNLLSEPIRKAALEKARDTGTLVASELVHLLTSEKEPGFLLFAPVYARGYPLDSMEERRAAFQGCVIGAFMFSGVISKALEGSLPVGLPFDLWDLSVTPEKRLLYHHVTRTRGDAVSKQYTRLPLQHISHFTTGGRLWQLVMVPENSFITVNRDRWPDAVPVIGVLITLAVSLLFFSLSTQRERAEELAVRREQEFRTLVEKVPSVVYRSEVAAPWTTHYMSEEIAAISGYSVQEFRRGSLRRGDIILPEDFARVEAEVARAVSKNHPFELEYRIQHKEGPVRWVYEKGQAIRNARGEPLYLNGIIIDITPRKEGEQRLADSEQWLRSMLQGSPVPAFVIDKGHTVVHWNQALAEISGLPAEQVLGTRDHWRAFYPEERPCMADLLVEGAFDKISQWYQHKFQPSKLIRGAYEAVDFFPMHGSQGRWLHFTAAVIRDASGAVAGAIETLLDITEIKQAEEERMNLERQVLHAQKLESLGVLAGGIAHDFNNLLMAVLGHADLALMDLSPLSPARGNIQEIETAARRAAELCRQMLAYSGKGRFIIESLDICELIEEMVHLLKTSIAKNVMLNLHLDNKIPPISGDASQIRQIIMNLITNASEAIGERPGSIRITTGLMHCDRAYLEHLALSEELEEGEYVYLEVSDTGCGMDKETMGRIFDPFFTTKFTGRGLGLAAVQGIVRGHKGALKVYSEAGKGTTFKVLFPAVNTEGPVHRHEAVSDTHWKGSGTILLVDDEEMVRSIAGEMLERLGFQVLTARDGVEALEVYQQRHPEIAGVLLDLTMPQMDGEETLRELRKIHPSVRVVLSSGYNKQEITQRFAGKGLAGFIQKPYRLAELKTVFHSMFNDGTAPG